jgi:uncharacterized membrane protein
MSLDTGKKLGITSSIIFIIAPIIAVSLYAAFFISLIGGLSSSITNGSVFPTSPVASLGLISLALGATGIITIIGFILFLITMYELSRYYNEPGIFKNIIYALITGIVGVVVIVAIVVALAFVTFGNGLAAPSASSLGLSFIGLLIGVTIGSIVVAIVSAIFVMRAFNKLGDKSDVHSFNTAGILILIGAIIPVVGSIISWIGMIFVLSGFFSLKPKPEVTSAYSSTPNSPSVNQNVIKCPQCGAENSINAEFCWSCGKQLK